MTRGGAAPQTTRQCRNCRHKPKHWARWQSDREIWHDGRCLEARRIVRSDGVCGQWEGWEEANHDDGE